MLYLAGPLVHTTAQITANKYLHIFNSEILAMVSIMLPNTVILQNENTSIRTAKKVQSWFEKHQDQISISSLVNTIARLLRENLLHRKVRLRGSVYGAHCRANWEANFHFGLTVFVTERPLTKFRLTVLHRIWVLARYQSRNIISYFELRVQKENTVNHRRQSSY